MNTLSQVTIDDIERQRNSASASRLIYAADRRTLDDLREKLAVEITSQQRALEASVQRMDSEERRLREMVQEYFQATGDRWPVKGVEIRLLRDLQYDPKVALKWAVDRQLTAVLRLNVREFEQLATGANLDLVSELDRIHVHVARNLDGITQREHRRDAVKLGRYEH